MDIKDLKSLLKVLRENGVTEYASSELQLKLTEDFITKSPHAKKNVDVVSDEPDMDSEWERLSDEEKLLWSAGE